MSLGFSPATPDSFTVSLHLSDEGVLAEQVSICPNKLVENEANHVLLPFFICLSLFILYIMQYILSTIKKQAII